MDEIFLDVEPREELGRSQVKHLRDAGFVPGVIYFHGEKSLPVKVSHKQFISLVHQHRSENLIVNLRVKGAKAKARPCLIKEIQYDPVRDDIVHVDFNEISLTQAIKVNVPVEATGEPIGVKQEGGSLEHTLWEIEIECLPTEIPAKFEVDVSNLKMGDAVHVKDIKIPPQIKVLTNPDATVLQVVAPMKEEVPVEAVEGAETQEPEVIKEKKEVPEEGKAEEPAKEKEKEKS